MRTFCGISPSQLLRDDVPIALKEWLFASLLFLAHFGALLFPCAATEVGKTAFPRQFQNCCVNLSGKV